MRSARCWLRELAQSQVHAVFGDRFGTRLARRKYNNRLPFNSVIETSLRTNASRSELEPPDLVVLDALDSHWPIHSSLNIYPLGFDFLATKRPNAIAPVA